MRRGSHGGSRKKRYSQGSRAEIEAKARAEKDAMVESINRSIFSVSTNTPMAAVRLQRVTGVMGHCPRLVVHSTPIFYPTLLSTARILFRKNTKKDGHEVNTFHGDVSRIIANVDTTSDVVFPVDKVAFGRRG
ncbi:hypothetical protein V1478_017168 [Vespula squamosa]|uniref:Uncharacterized protein n=1 Tax=Vespula squamosa TaxID=30214 RepID=A0ABD2A120_VESSQ